MRVWRLKIVRALPPEIFDFLEKAIEKNIAPKYPGTGTNFLSILAPFPPPFTTSVDIFFYNFRRSLVSFRRSGGPIIPADPAVAGMSTHRECPKDARGRSWGKKKRETSSNQKKIESKSLIVGNFWSYSPKNVSLFGRTKRAY